MRPWWSGCVGQPREQCFCWLPARVSIAAVRATPCLSSEGDQLSQFAQDCGFSCDVKLSELKLENPLLPGMYSSYLPLIWLRGSVIDGLEVAFTLSVTFLRAC